MINSIKIPVKPLIQKRNRLMTRVSKEFEENSTLREFSRIFIKMIEVKVSKKH